MVGLPCCILITFFIIKVKASTLGFTHTYVLWSLYLVNVIVPYNVIVWISIVEYFISVKSIVGMF
jgi:hypothetical protein